MKRILFAIIGICTLAGAYAQNAAPTISNLTTVHNSVTNEVSFTFDLNDAENDPCDLQLRVSGDDGRTWLIDLNTIVGDTGFPQMPGTGKNITWTYNPSVLASQTGTGLVALKARIIADDRNSPDIQDIVDSVDSTRLVQTLQFVEGTRHRTAGPVHLQAVRDSIENLMATNGLQDWHHAVTFGGTSGNNYVGRISGLLEEPETYLVSGHYDSEPNTPGADDNGTATAAVMEIIRIISNYEYRHSIRSLAFDLEEAGLIGSIDYVLNEIQPWEDIEGLLNMEMIGYFDNTPNSQSLPVGFNLLFPDAFNAVMADSSRGNFLTNVANVASNSLKETFDTCAATYVPGLKVISLAAPGNALVAPDLRRSDHAPFWDAGYQALMLTDAANLRNPHYHTPGDSIGTLDLGFYVQNVKAILATLVKLADPLNATFAVSDTFTVDIPVGVETGEIPMDFIVYPNPSDGGLQISFSNNGQNPVRIALYNLKGQQLAEVTNQTYPSGTKIIHWFAQQGDGSPIPSGQYILKFEHGKQVAHQRISILH